MGKVAEGTIEVQAGASLESLVRAALDAGYARRVMTGCVMLSAGGFLSAGGQSRGSQRYGAFVDQVTELDVVTGDGRLVTCSETRDRELFEMALAGMGQCGIIVRARLKVIPAGEQVALRTLVYASLETFLSDESRIASEERFDVIEGAVVRSGGPNWSYHITVGNYGTAAANIDPVERIRDLSPETVTDLTRQDYRSGTVPGPRAVEHRHSVPPRTTPPEPAPTAVPSRRAGRQSMVGHVGSRVGGARTHCDCTTAAEPHRRRRAHRVHGAWHTALSPATVSRAGRRASVRPLGTPVRDARCQPDTR